ncbi:hypothetical protein BGZ76_006783 [Entomortierella beljakovae]|nr:hypothetical protein BGZ76_006783 [Entomortierella beljakovae]
MPKSTHKLARALLLPILENPSVIDSRISSVLIVGINPYRVLDNQYLDFLALLVANTSSLLHFGKSREDERKSVEALYEINNAKIAFFQNVSHELRTPLTLMMAPLEEVLDQTPENTPARSSLEMVRRNSRRLLKLVNTLLQFSRIEAGKGHAMFEETDITKATKEISANFESVARGFGLEYIINCESLENVSMGIWVDRAMWSGIILNLLGNAFKHTWTGSITVHQYPLLGENNVEGIAVDIRDTGVGISPEHLPTLFGRFNRIENKQSRSHEGTGIGLSLVKELTELHGGHVSVTSSVGKGSCFRIWIPSGKSHYPASQVKISDSIVPEVTPSSRFEALNNKTDASMFVEEANQWIAHKAIPGSTLSASGTDSTEDEKADDDDALSLNVDYLRDPKECAEMNTNFEISTLNMTEDELTRILLDPPENEVEVPQKSLKSNSNPANTAHARYQNKRLSLGDLSAATHPLKNATSADNIFEDEEDENGRNDGNGQGDDHVEAEELRQQPEEETKLLPKATTRRGYIMVVDDNNDMRTYLKEILVKDFRVRCAVDGLDALRMIRERLSHGKRIDLILSDVAMPNMDGYELLRRLRKDPATMMTPIILLSARAGEESNVEGLDLGADDCLAKPFSSRELLARVRSTIRLSDLRHELIREQRHALEMKRLVYSISVRIRGGLSLPQVLDTASRELFKVIRCNAIRICRFSGKDPSTGQHWIKFVTEIVRIGTPKVLSLKDRLLPKGLEVSEASAGKSDNEAASDLRNVTNYQHPIFGAKNYMSVALIHNRKIWGYLTASRDVDAADWTRSEKLLFEQTGNQISMAIAHAHLWEIKKAQQVEMEAVHAANEAKSQILANTSHELRTPIGAIIGALSALEDTDYNLTSEQRDMVKIMQITSDVALSVINDLLDTAKLESKTMNLNIKECPGLIETLSQSVRIFSDKAGRKEVDLIMEPSEDIQQLDSVVQQGSVIWTDGDRLQQVMMNLIGNAVKFTAAGKILITYSLVKPKSGGTPLFAGNEPTFSDTSQPSHDLMSHDGQSPRISQVPNIPAGSIVTQTVLRFEISDTGIGIDQDFLRNQIFKSFAQYDQSMTRRFGGTGLGLAISKHLVMMNGGSLGVTSIAGQGSTFYFTWPISLVGPSHPRQTDIQKSITPKIMLSPEVAFETRAVIVESVPESRHLIAWILNQQNVKVSLYDSCENVYRDEKNRKPDLEGLNGKTLIPNYRSNAHFFFCTRASNAEEIVATAKALGTLFKQRNIDAKSKEGNENYKDVILSVILVVFSSPQGRQLAKDMSKRIRSGGLDDTVQCRYVIKPVKEERIVDCLQMLGPHAPYTRGVMDEGYPGKLLESGTSYPGQFNSHHWQQPMNTGNIQQWRTSPSIGGVSSSSPKFQGTDDNTGLAASYYYERDLDSNKNTSRSLYDDSEETGAVEKVNIAVDIKDVSSGDDDGGLSQRIGKQNEPQPNIDSPSIQSQQKPSLAMQRRLRAKLIGDGTSPIETPATSNKAARSAGKRERKGKCVLCVEDNIINLRVVQYQLQKLGYDTQSACDGQVAVDIIKSQVDMINLQSQNSGAEDYMTSHIYGKSQLIENGAATVLPPVSSATPVISVGSPVFPSSASSPNLSAISTEGKPSTSFASPAIYPGHSPELHSIVAGSTSSLPSPSSAKQIPNKIDLILMDCAMPVKSGFDAASEIRTMGKSSTFASNIPIIALTASAVPSTKEKCIASGMNGYLSKPTKLGDLEAMLNQWIKN